jgi:hypothetical protein
MRIYFETEASPRERIIATVLVRDAVVTFRPPPE